MVDLSIIIVSWNIREYLAACLDSLHGNAGDLNIEIIVVDSASTDGTPEMVRSRYPWVTLLPQLENVGITRGNNIGLAASHRRHVMLLNSDTEVIVYALVQIVAY